MFKFKIQANFLEHLGTTRDNCRLYDVGDRIGQLIIVKLPDVALIDGNTERIRKEARAVTVPGKMRKTNEILASLLMVSVAVVLYITEQAAEEDVRTDVTVGVRCRRWSL